MTFSASYFYIFILCYTFILICVPLRIKKNASINRTSWTTSHSNMLLVSPPTTKPANSFITLIGQQRSQHPALRFRWVLFIHLFKAKWVITKESYYSTRSNTAISNSLPMPCSIWLDSRSLFQLYCCVTHTLSKL